RRRPAGEMQTSPAPDASAARPRSMQSWIVFLFRKLTTPRHPLYRRSEEIRSGLSALLQSTATARLPRPFSAGATDGARSDFLAARGPGPMQQDASLAERECQG